MAEKRRGMLRRAFPTAALLATMPAIAHSQQSSSASPSPSSSGRTDFLTANSRGAIRAMERHLFPDGGGEVPDGIARLFRSRVAVVDDGGGGDVSSTVVHTYPSLRYTPGGFWRNWKRMAIDGVPAGDGSIGSGGAGGGGRLVLFAGDDEDHHHHRRAAELGGDGQRRTARVRGYEYGLANMAAFLSQVAVYGIHPDSCEEGNVQGMTAPGGEIVLPPSNACGQYNMSYQDLTCPPDERDMECRVDPEMTIPPPDDGDGGGADGAPFHCGPAGAYPGWDDDSPNDLGRTDVGGCCWWGRGPLRTRGPCNLGKVNHYLGSKALDEGRITPSTIGGYGGVDFCATPQAVCGSDDEDLLWSVAMLEWAERVQRYRSHPSPPHRDDDGGEDGDGGPFPSSRAVWDYSEKLVEFVDGGMNSFEYYRPGEGGGGDGGGDGDRPFIDAVSSIVDRGCHDAPNCEPFFGNGAADKLSERRTAFTAALSALRIPTMRTELVVEQALDHLRSRRDGFESNLLLYKRDGGIHPSHRYTFDGLVDSIYRMSRPYDATDALYSNDTTYFYSADHAPFYMGDPFMKHGHKYGLANIALFFANGLDLSIEKDDACDEVNEHEVSGRLAVSSSCGQRGLSYQDMGCPDDPDMACPVDPDMFITAVTKSRAFGAAPPMQCGPKSRIPSTGYWDDQEMYESAAPYANENARVDVEGCCWWARGVLQTKGTCSFGRLNYYMGKRAADEGRESLFPTIDFCLQPESICGSRYRHELIWMAGLFEWIDRVQSYDKGGFNYMRELRVFADGGMMDDVFIKRVGAIAQSGCHSPPCEGAGCLNFPCGGASPADEESIVTKAFRTIMELGLWDEFPLSYGGSNAPSPQPTPCQVNCTEEPTLSPLTPTDIPSGPPSESPTQVMDMILGRFEELKEYLERRRQHIMSTVFVSKTNSGLAPSNLYRIDGFLIALEDFATEGVDGALFDIGQGAGDSLEHGLVNIALFLAHAMTRGILWDTCEEVNVQLVNGKLPLSNACGQHGLSYEDQICPLSDADMQCPVNKSMSVTQVSAGSSGSPPFFCAPRTAHPFTGYYDPLSGSTVSTEPFANAVHRVDVSGCCFWGRGILLNSGVCDIGRFNHLYGLPAIMDGRAPGYNIDFCSHPSAICSEYVTPPTEFTESTTIDTSEARYQIGMIYWIDYVQNYDSGDYNYRDEVRQFLDGGLRNFSFVDEFSEIVINSSRDGSTRKSNFVKILEVLFMVSTESPTTLSPSTISPTNSPTSKPTSAKPTNADTQSLGPTPGTVPEQVPANNGSQPGTGRDPNRPVSLDLSIEGPYIADFSDSSVGQCFRDVWNTIWIFLFSVAAL